MADSASCSCYWSTWVVLLVLMVMRDATLRRYHPLFPILLSLSHKSRIVLGLGFLVSGHDGDVFMT